MNTAARLLLCQPMKKRRQHRFTHEMLLELSVIEMELQRLRMEEKKLIERRQRILARGAQLTQRQLELYAQLKLSPPDATAPQAAPEKKLTHKSATGIRHQTWSY